jgi:hypothetical protein
MITKKELNEMKVDIFEGMYNGEVLEPLLRTLNTVNKSREEARLYIKQNKLQNTTPGRAFDTADKNFKQALRFYAKAKELLDKLQ